MNVANGAFQVIGFASSGLLLTVIDLSEVLTTAAVLATTAVVVLRWRVAERPPRRSGGVGLRETWHGNRQLVANRRIRPLLIALTVPNGLVVGCEALFVAYAGGSAGLLLAAVALGMMAGDLVVGRLLDDRGRRQSALWLRFVLAAPFLAFAGQPGLALAAALVGVAAVGYAASLPQQEQLLRLTATDLHGQALGVEGAVRMASQGVFAVLAGALAELVPVGTAIAALAAASLAVSLALTPALTRSTRSAEAWSTTATEEFGQRREA